MQQDQCLHKQTLQRCWKNAPTGLNQDRWTSDRAPAESPEQTFSSSAFDTGQEGQRKKSANISSLIGLSTERMLKIILQELAQSNRKKTQQFWVVFLSYLMWALVQVKTSKDFILLWTLQKPMQRNTKQQWKSS